MLSWASEHSWWTAPLDVRRLHPRHDTRVVTTQQVTALVGRLGEQDPVPLFVFDAGDDPSTLTWHLGGVRAQLLVRIRADWVCYTEPPARRHGTRFGCADRHSWGRPGQAYTPRWPAAAAGPPLPSRRSRPAQ